jgi:glycerol-3-phosphate acyltransferase PlsY
LPHNLIVFGEIFLAMLAIGVAYLIGSIPSAYLIGRWLKGLDIREAGDGRLGAAMTYRRVGFLGGLIVALIDVGKGMAAVMIAKALGLPLALVVTAGLAAVVGHNWSIFLQFKGGKGALTTYGVLLSLMFWQLFAAMAAASVVFVFTRKTGFSTGVLFCFLAILNLFTGSPIVLVITPILISVPMVLKDIYMPKADVAVMAGAEHNREEV